MDDDALSPVPVDEADTRIACIRTHRLEHRLEEPFGFSQWRYDKRQALLVEVIASSGATGWGECYGPAAVTQTAIESFYAPRLIGWDALKPEAAWQHCWRASLDFARKGVMMGAMSGLDMALLDLRGNILGVSASELMGGRIRDAVPCYATGMYYRDTSEQALLEIIAREAQTYVDRGYQALKIKVGKNLAFDRKLIEQMRDQFPRTQLMADANHAYDLPEAIAIGRLLDALDYAWFEEPLSPQHPALFRQLADKLDLPLATGECEQTRWGFADLLAQGGVQIVQPDLAYCGGPTEAMKIRAIASTQGVNVVPHAWGTMLNLSAALHMLATTPVEPGRAEPAPLLLETDRTPNPMRDEMFTMPLDIDAGRAIVPTAPGLGVQPDRDAMTRFCTHTTEST